MFYKIITYLFLILFVSSCSTSMMKKRYSHGYTFFNHKSKTAHETGGTKSSQKEIAAKETITTKELIVKAEPIKNERFVCAVRKEGRAAFKSLVKEKQRPVVYFKAEFKEIKTAIDIKKKPIGDANAAVKLIVFLVAIGFVITVLFFIFAFYFLGGGIISPGSWVVIGIIFLLILLALAKVLVNY